MKEKLKQHASKFYIVLAFISGGGLGQLTDFAKDVKEIFQSEAKKPKIAKINDGDFETKIRYMEKDFQLNNNKAEESK